MTVGTLDTVQLQNLIDRMRAGDAAARERIVQSYYSRLSVLTRRMLRKYPGVRRWEDTGDVLHAALMRLLRALEELRPESTRAFIALAALQIRRELINLLHHYFGPLGAGANQDVPPKPGERAAIPQEPPVPGDDLRELEKWTAFHGAVETLPDEEQEVVNLIFYHGLTKEGAADVLGVSARTARRRWGSALTKLRNAVDTEE